MSTKTDRELSKSVFYLKVLYLFIRKRGFTVVALSMAKEGVPGDSAYVDQSPALRLENGNAAGGLDTSHANAV